MPRGDAATPPAWPPEGSRLTLTPAEWRARLTPAWYDVHHEHGTEHAFLGPSWDHDAVGTYAGLGCGALA